jgi:N-acetylneuraminate synthase
MILTKSVERFSVPSQTSVAKALEKISANHERIVFCLDHHGVIEGVLTDGDFRRWILGARDIDLSQPVAAIANRSFVSTSDATRPEEIRAMFGKGVDHVPVVNGRGQLVGVASRGSSTIELGGASIGPGHPVFVIAEIGINHNGSVERAKQLVDEAVAAGADCAKFQLRDLGALYRHTGDGRAEDLGVQYTYDILGRFNLAAEQLFDVFDHCRARGIIPLCTPWDVPSAEALLRYGTLGFKIASADLTNHELLDTVSASGLPIIVSTGMSTESEIIESVGLLRRRGTPFALLHCNSAYPAPFKDVHLPYIGRLAELGDCPVGYSGHERGIHVAIAAVAAGACIVEKHLTVDRELEGNDHKVSLLPGEFAAMVAGIREVEEASRPTSARRPTQGELLNRVALAKSLVVTRDVAAGEVVTPSMVAVKGPGQGLQPNRRDQLIGVRLTRPMRAGDFFYEDDILGSAVTPRPYSFRRPWGIPVRYHDLPTLVAASSPDFVEFHLTFKDMEVELGGVFSEKARGGLAVHSPDLFAGDHLLNLAAADDSYRRRSVRELQRVVDLTRELNRWFPDEDRPTIIASLGGFTEHHPVAPAERGGLYGRVATSLSELDLEGVELVAQTLPPFPWYFGGQLHCNLFVDAADTAAFCSAVDLGLCFDVSHSKLTVNHRKESLADFVSAIGDHIRHLHIVDAAGVDGEGLQIGDGEIDFGALAHQLDAVAPDVRFIPEIWQGHVNGGQGFWIALERLERWF